MFRGGADLGTKTTGGPKPTPGGPTTTIEPALEHREKLLEQMEPGHSKRMAAAEQARKVKAKLNAIRAAELEEAGRKRLEELGITF